MAEIEKSSQALDQAVTGAVRELREENMENVSRSVLVFITYTFGSLLLVRFMTMVTMIFLTLAGPGHHALHHRYRPGCVSPDYGRFGL